MVVQACNPRTREAEVGGLPVQNWPELPSKTPAKANGF